MNFKKISFNSPVILIFTALCFFAFAANIITSGGANRLFFSVYNSSLTSPLTYFRFIGHVFGHADWAHLSSNIVMILLLGPLLEEKYGAAKISIVMVITAVVTGIINFFIFRNTALLGSSGIVFAFIILSSFTGTRNGKIPITFILIAIIYIGGQIYDGIFLRDNISNITHIVGGIVGGVCGFLLKK